MPYLAVNVSDFWKRWHISLSTWLRDYLFIPLGGSRGTKWQTYRNLLITMTLGGLWHGASWTFVIWGLLHGILLIAHRLMQDICAWRPRLDRVLQSPPGTVLRWLTTLCCVGICWIFFRASSFTTAAAMLRRVHGHHQGLPPAMATQSLWCLLAIIALGHIVGQQQLWNRWIARLPAPVLGFAYAMVLTFALLLAPDSGKAFIYFQF